MLPYVPYDERVRAFILPPRGDVAAHRVVVTTCGAAGMLREGWYAAAAGQSGSGLRSLDFSHVLIDEAGQALAPEALIPLSLLRPSGGAAVLCGDHLCASMARRPTLPVVLLLGYLSSNICCRQCGH